MIYLIYAEIGRLYSGFDDYPDLCRNFGIELDCCVVFTDGFNVVSNDDFLFIHLNAEDSADFFGNILYKDTLSLIFLHKLFSALAFSTTVRQHRLSF